jgi:hypothetical protein
VPALREDAESKFYDVIEGTDSSTKPLYLLHIEMKTSPSIDLIRVCIRTGPWAC